MRFYAACKDRNQEEQLRFYKRFVDDNLKLKNASGRLEIKQKFDFQKIMRKSQYQECIKKTKLQKKSYENVLKQGIALFVF